MGFKGEQLLETDRILVTEWAWGGRCTVMTTYVCAIFAVGFWYKKIVQLSTFAHFGVFFLFQAVRRTGCADTLFL